MSRQLELLCWQLGDEPYCIFTVKIKASETVSVLKEKIKKKASHINCPANALIIWKNETSKTDDESLSKLNLDVRGDIAGARKLDSWDRLRIVFADAPKNEEKIHIFIQLPHSTITASELPDLNSTKLPLIPRAETVCALYQKLHQHGFILLRGPAGSGKSALMRLLQEYIHKKEPTTKVIRFLAGTECHDYLEELAANGWNRHDSSVLILDEGQVTYWNDSLWTFFSDVLGQKQPYKHRVAISCGQASPTGPSAQDLVMPLQLALHKTVTLCPIDHQDGTPPAGVFFTLREVGDLISTRYYGDHFTPGFVDWVHQFTGGHPGSTIDLLDAIENSDVYRSLLKKKKLYSPDDAQADLQMLLCKLEGLGASIRRSLPSKLQLASDDALNHVLATICSSNAVTYSTFTAPEHQTALRTSYINGWVHTEVLDSIHHHYVLASPLHRQLLERKIWGKLPERVFKSSHATPLAFCIEVIRQFSSNNLVSQRKVGPTGAPRPPEAQYQDEFYRCTHLISQGATTIFSEYALGEGRVDFYIPQKRWAVELLRDGQKLVEHCGRFLTSGRYGQSHDIDDYIVLDCRTTTPQRSHPNCKNLYHVVFTRGFTGARVLDNKCGVVQDFISLS
ncbi:hypothetical protein M405DRAFT_928653 [Rhizopogon salebrosus TDB-379]|nr:hypothetical protein M405DRAFT_928653 [Rhizopogon salebrosus TDB-379]